MKKSISIILFIAIAGIVVVFLGSCNDTSKPPLPSDEKEFITTFKIELKDTVNGALFSYFYRDTDGEGGKVPIQCDTILLDTQIVYKATLKILNETNPNSIIDVSNEIKTESTSHIICYTSNISDFKITRTDTDGTYTIGLESIWKASTVAFATLNIKLKHQSGLKNGTCDLGTSDFIADFPVKIK